MWCSVKYKALFMALLKGHAKVGITHLSICHRNREAIGKGIERALIGGSLAHNQMYVGESILLQNLPIIVQCLGFQLGIGYILSSRNNKEVILLYLEIVFGNINNPIDFARLRTTPL